MRQVEHQCGSIPPLSVGGDIKSSRTIGRRGSALLTAAVASLGLIGPRFAHAATYYFELDATAIGAGSIATNTGSGVTNTGAYNWNDVDWNTVATGGGTSTQSSGSTDFPGGSNAAVFVANSDAGTDGFTVTLAGSAAQTWLGALTVNSGNPTIAVNGANFVLGATSTWTIATGSTLNVSGLGSGSWGALNMNTNSLIVAGGGNLNVAGMGNSGGALTMNGAGTLTISGASNYSGATTINSGTLQIGAGGSTGSLSGSTAITDSSSLIFDLSGNIAQGSGFGTIVASTGTVTQAGTGTLTLSASNAYSGGTTVSAGTLKIGGSSTPTSGTVTSGPVGTGAVNLNGGALSNSGQFAIGNNVTVTSGITSAITIAGANFILNGSLSSTTNTGAAVLNLSNTGAGASLQLGGDSSGFYGTINFNNTNMNLGLLNANANLSNVSLVFPTGSVNSGFGLNLVPTTPGSGTVQLGALSSSGTGTGYIAVTDNGFTETLQVGALNTTTTYAGNIGTFQGTLALTKVGSGTLTLSGVNSYTGATTINAGVLILNSTNATTIASTQVNINNGTELEITQSGGAGQYQFTAATTFAFDANGGGSVVTGTGVNWYPGGGNFTFATNGGAQDIISGSAGLNLNGSFAAIFNVSPGTNSTADLNVSARLWNGGSVQKTGTGILELSGPNVYSGGTTISGGTVKIASATALGSGTASVIAGAVLDLNGQTLTNSNALTLNGAGISSGGALTNSSATAVTYPGLITLGSTGVSIIASSGNIILSNTGTITGSGDNLNLGGTAAGSSVASIIGTGAGTLTKSGSGTWTLTANNTYTGTTTVNGGTLILTGSANSYADGNLFINGASTLRINGAALNFSGKTFTFDSTGGGTLDAEATGAGGFYFLGNNTIATSGGAQDIVSGTQVGSNNLGINLNGQTAIFNVSPGTNSTADLNVVGTLWNSGGIQKTGTGVLELSGGNTYSSGTTISSGTVKIANATALGGGAVSVTAGAVLDLNGQTLTNSNALTLNGTGISSGGALTNSSATAVTYPGLITLGSTGVSIVASSGNIILSNTGTITGSGNALTLDGTAAGSSIASIIGTGAGTVTKNGSGTWTLTANNTYTGATTVNAGILLLSTSNVTSMASTQVNINNGSELEIAQTGGAGQYNFTSATTFTFDASGSGSGGGSIVAGSGVNWYPAGGNFTFATNGGAQDIISGSAGLNLNGSFAAIFNVSPGTNSTADLNVSARLWNGGSVQKTGTGILELSGPNVYSGGTTISAGTVKIASATALGTAAVSVTAGAVLDLNGQTLTNSNALTLNGTGISSGGALTNSNATAATYPGLITLGSTGVSIVASSGNIILSNAGTITGSGDALTLDGTATGSSIASIIGTGAGTVTKNGSGTWTLTGNNTFTGVTTINGGLLDFNGNGSPTLYHGSQININNGSELEIAQFGGNAQYQFTAATTFTFDESGSGSGGGSIVTGSGVNWYPNGGSFTFTTSGGARDNISGSSGLNLNGNSVIFNVASGTDGISDITVSIGMTNSSGSLTKNGPGILTLTGANAYSGATTINAGTLQIGNGGTTGSLSGSTAITDNAALVFDLSGNITQGSGFGTIVASTGTLTQAGTGTVTLSAANAYTGTTTVLAGTLVAGTSNGVTGLSSSSAILLGNTSGTSAATLQLGSSSTATYPNNITVQTGSSGVMTLNGHGNITLNGTVTLGTASSAGQSLAIADPGNVAWVFAIGGIIQDPTGLTPGTAGAVTIGSSNIGTVKLSGPNTYTGGTILTAGTLAIAASSSPTSGTVTSGPVGTGTLNLNGGTLSSSGQYAIGNNITVTSGATSTITIAGVNFALNGTLSSTTNAGTAILNLSNSGGPASLQVGGDTSGFYGTINFNNTNMNLGILNANTNLSNARLVFPTGSVNINYGLNLAPTTAGNGTVQLGALSSSGSGTGYVAISDNGFTETLQVGALNTSTTFAGNIGTVQGTLALAKVGTGTLTLTGTESYTGTTTVSGGGTLALTGSGGAYTGGNLFIDGASTLRVVGTALSFSGKTFTFDSTGGGTLDGEATGAGGLYLTATTTIATGGGAQDIISGTHGGSNNLGINLNSQTVIFNVVPGTNPIADLNIAGTLWNSGSIQKTGTGTLEFTAVSTYSGTTTITNGTLQIGGGGTTGSLSTSSTISDFGTLAFDRTNNVAQGTDFTSAAITGTGGVTQSGTGALTLSSANTYSGPTILNAGTVMVGLATAGGATPTSGALGVNSAVTINGGATLDLNGLNQTIGSLSDNAGSGGTITSSATGTITLITGGNNASTSFAGIIQNGSAASLGLTKIGVGIQTLTGTNTYTGATTINSGGTLQLGNGGTTGSLSANSPITNNGTLAFSRSNAVVQGTDFASAGIIGGGSLTQNGATLSSALTLNANNTYSGGTTINGGTLLANNATSSTGSGGVTVNSGARLGGNGTIANTAGPVTIGGGAILSPGSGAGGVDPDNGVGVLTTGDVVLIGSEFAFGSGTYNWTINSASPSTGINQDELKSTGNLAINTGGGTFNLAIVRTAAQAWTTIPVSTTFVVANASTITLDGTTIADTSPATESAVASAFNITDSTGAGGPETWTASVAQDGGGWDLDLTVTTAPEPASLGLLGVASLGLLRRRRRMRKE